MAEVLVPDDELADLDDAEQVALLERTENVLDQADAELGQPDETYLPPEL